MMDFNELVARKSEWTKGGGPFSDIAISTRVRIARNLEGHLYFNRAGDEQREATLRKVISELRKSPFFADALILEMRKLSDVDRDFLVERHLMSREHATDVDAKALAVDGKGIVSAMLNEEDHLRLQVLLSGFDIMEAWRIVDEIETDLGKHMNFDFSNKFGYLTSCPTNTGTGLRASVMLHLSALAMTGQIEKVFDAISKIGLTMRGFYGEGTEALGDFYQISNQVALGRSEMDILDSLDRVIRKIIKKEEEARSGLFETRREELFERINRSFDTLRGARIITAAETVKLLSAIRLGASLGIIKGVSREVLNEVLLDTQPGHLEKLKRSGDGGFDEDIERAELIRKKLGGM